MWNNTNITKFRTKNRKPGLPTCPFPAFMVNLNANRSSQIDDNLVYRTWHFLPFPCFPLFYTSTNFPVVHLHFLSFLFTPPVSLHFTNTVLCFFHFHTASSLLAPCSMAASSLSFPLLMILSLILWLIFKLDLEGIPKGFGGLFMFKNIYI